ncbi:MAG: transketolase [Clostridia bacterium]|nr:transketolase [Clostridia bacterium]
MNITQKSINELRVLAAETISNAKSGHPGVALGATTILYALFKDHYFYDIKDPKFMARDRFVLSAGHASALYYSVAHLFNYGTTMDDLKNFRKLNSKTPGHPEVDVTNYVEASTGPLGQGVANAVGMALARSVYAEKFNAQKFPIFNNFVYCFCGDGCLMEGVATEAISFAGAMRLKNLILLYDCNKITIDGKLGITNTENVVKKFKSMNWNVIVCRNGNNYSQVTRAIGRAKNSSKPTIVVFNTTIGYGSSLAGTADVHGKPLNEEQLEHLKKNLGVEKNFELSEDVKTFALKTAQKNRIALEKWNRMFVMYQSTNPELFKQLQAYLEEKDVDITKILKPEVLKQDLSGRDANALIIKELAQKHPRFMGGTADLAPSVKAYIPDGGDYSEFNRRGRNIRFGIREHAMGAISNGLALYFNSPVFCSTFMAFSNYQNPAIRMSALMNVPVWYMYTHDSYKIGEDGPTHQSIEQLGSLRLIPNLNVFRPSDTTELLACYDVALKQKSPCAFVLTKQKLKAKNSDIKNAQKGGYILEGKDADVLLMASGSEVDLAMEIKEKLDQENITACVASFPCLELFEKQTTKYKQSVLSKAPLKVVIEASNDAVWYKYLTEKDIKIEANAFGKSASEKDLNEHYGFTANQIIKKIKQKLK